MPLNLLFIITEAEYAYRLRKDIIPLLGQDGYVPDGWLGAFVGSRLHFDFSADEKIQLEIQKVKSVNWARAANFLRGRLVIAAHGIRRRIRLMVGR